MVPYLSATQTRLWDVFRAGVPDWDKRVTPGGQWNFLGGPNAAKAAGRQRVATDPASCPSLSIAPTSFTDQGFNAPGARTFANHGKAPLAGAAIVTSESVTYELTLTYRDLNLAPMDALWVPMKAALYRAGSKLSLAMLGTPADKGLHYVLNWAPLTGTFRRENVKGEDRWVQRVGLTVNYAFTEADLYEESA